MPIHLIQVCWGVNVLGDVTKKYLIKRKEQLKEDRVPWEKNWKESQKYILPFSGRFLVNDNKSRNYNNIIDNTGTIASRTLASGLMSGLTSPARPWFKLSHPNKDLTQYEPVKVWLEEVTKRMRHVFSSSNLYQILPSLYREMGIYGVGALMPTSDYNKIVHFKQFTVGEYYIGSNSKRQIDSLFRENSQTVKQVVDQFGINAVSNRTRNLFLSENYEQKITINHLIEPNLNRNITKKNNKNMPFRSCYWEDGGGEDVIKQSGFDDFPLMVPRWDVIVGDTYGYGPASEALGDVKQLQHEQKMKGVAIEKMVNPPMVTDASMRGDVITNAPSSVTYLNIGSNTSAFGLKEAYQVRVDVNHLMMDIKETQDRIKTAFYSDLFLMLHESDRRQITAYEVAEKNQEKLIMLGPVLQRFNDELLKPLVNWVFKEMVSRGFVPPAPQELQDKELTVEFISLLAQAQEMVGIGGIERLAGFVGNLASIEPSVVDKFNFEKAVDEYSTILGTPAEITNTDDEVAEKRKIRAEQQQMQQMAEMAPAMAQGAQAAKTLSETNLAGLTEQVNGGVM